MPDAKKQPDKDSNTAPLIIGAAILGVGAAFVLSKGTEPGGGGQPPTQTITTLIASFA